MQSSRLKQVQEHLCTLNSLCLVLGFDFKQTINGIHPSLLDSEGSKSVSNDTIQQLAVAIQELREVKLQRMQKVKIDLELIVICIQNFVFFFSLVIVVITYGLVAPRSCDYNVGALELDGYPY